MPTTYVRDVVLVLMLVASALGAAALAADPVTPTGTDRQAQARARMDACRPDIQRFCGDVEAGGGRKMACLRMHIAELTPACRDALPGATTRKGGPSAGDGVTK